MTPPQPRSRKLYEPPAIEDLGTLVDLTRGVGGTGSDASLAGSGLAN